MAAARSRSSHAGSGAPPGTARLHRRRAAEIDRRDLAREPARVLEQIFAPLAPSTMPSGACPPEVDGIAAQHALERRRRSDEPRQALRAARARQEAEANFRQAERDIRRGQAIVTRERELEAAAEHRAMQRRDDRLARGLDAQQHVVQERRARLVVEFADVGARDEMPAGTVDDQGAYRRVGLCRFDRREKGHPHRLRERIHRRIDRSRSRRPRRGARCGRRARSRRSRSNPLEDHGDALPDADAHGAQRAAAAAALELAQRRRREARAARAERMAERDGAALRGSRARHRRRCRARAARRAPVRQTPR